MAHFLPLPNFHVVREPLVRIAAYELLELLGRGGMGAVYRGRHLETGQTVAVKVMAPELVANPTHLRRFEQECQIALRLHHPHIVQGLDFGVEDAKPYLVMEFVEGQNLGRRVRDLGPLAEAEAVGLIVQIADALRLAHEQKIIHRDVKPENILLTDDGQAKLADLGLSKDQNAEGNLTQTQSCLGTAVFMAPEQFDDARNADVRCDVYGLGATLYYLLTGAAPFQGRGNLTILAKKLKNEFVPPRQIVPTLRYEIDRTICLSLHVEPSRRPATCVAFAEALTQALAEPQRHVAGSGADAQSTEIEIPDVDERRIARRYPCALDASCSPLQGGLRQWRGEVIDISLSGVHLQLDRRFEPGAVLRLEVLDEQLAVVATWLVRARWVREVSSRRWSIGCAFNSELSDEELTAFLAALPPTVIVQDRA